MKKSELECHTAFKCPKCSFIYEVRIADDDKELLRRMLIGHEEKLKLMSAQLKAKDEEIKELSKKCAEIAYDFENAVEEIEKLKTKDDEIKELKLELLKSFPKIANTKARKIVAMLFWEWRRLETEGITEEAFATKACFYKAHALLKE